MNDKVKIVLIAVIVVIAALLVAGSLQSSGKIKQLQSQVLVLNEMLDDKDKEMSKLVLNIQGKQVELESVKKELENVKTELSDTVIKLQTLSPIADTTKK